MLVGRLFGHRWRFSAQGATMRWACTRGCGAGGEKRYESAERAARDARAFDREDRDDLGRRPLLCCCRWGWRGARAAMGADAAGSSRKSGWAAAPSTP